MPSILLRIFCLSLCIVCFCFGADAQVPEIIDHVVRLDDGGRALTGTHGITIRWYDVASGGSPAFEEDYVIDVVDGMAHLPLGRQKGLPDVLLSRGDVWIGVAVDDGSERVPRRRLLAIPYARVAAHATVADALSPDVTGIVTSINEVGGAVRIVGGSGVTVDRDGSILRLSADTSSHGETGELDGDGRAYRFTIKPTSKLGLTDHVTVSVVTGTETTIACTVGAIDVDDNTFDVVTSAILQPGERIRWKLSRR